MTLHLLECPASGRIRGSIGRVREASWSENNLVSVTGDSGVIILVRRHLVAVQDLTSEQKIVGFDMVSGRLKFKESEMMVLKPSKHEWTRHELNHSLSSYGISFHQDHKEFFLRGLWSPLISTTGTDLRGYICVLCSG